MAWWRSALSECSLDLSLWSFPLPCTVGLKGWVLLQTFPLNSLLKLCCFVYLFIWVLTSLSTHCTGHIMTDSFMGRGNQYIQLVKVLYCKLPTNGKQLPAFPLEVGPGTETLISEVRGESVTTLPLWPLVLLWKHLCRSPQGGSAIWAEGKQPIIIGQDSAQGTIRHREAATTGGPDSNVRDVKDVEMKCILPPQIQNNSTCLNRKWDYYKTAHSQLSNSNIQFSVLTNSEEQKNLSCGIEINDITTPPV